MVWFKIDDHLHDHRKVLKLLRSGEGKVDAAPMGLWALAGAWCGDNLTDGFVPDYLLDRWDDHAWDYANRLVDVGLWAFDEHDGDTGVRFINWETQNPVKSDVTAKREYRRLLAELRRSGITDAVVERDCGRCRYCGRKVSFGDRVGALGGTYDHVIPVSKGGQNDFENVVVACRSCNSAKGARTPEEWGKKLLKPGATNAKKTRNGGPTTAPRTRTKPVPGTGQIDGGRPQGRDGSVAGHAPGSCLDVPGTPEAVA